ncbi:MAG TPA: flagellar basal body protein [Caulobacteraceae bacterium]|nr:flagellar basal body protein [Caulobacteraceae bacterium]
MSAEPDQHAALEAIVKLTEKLTALLAEQARAFERHRPQDAARDLAEVSRLTNVYRDASAHVRANPQMVETAPALLRQRLLRATEAFDAVLQRQGRALGASKTVTEGLVKAIAHEIAAQRGLGQAYGPNAGRRAAASATAITLNRQA